MKEELEQIFESGAQAQYECWDPQGDGDVGRFTKLKDKAVRNGLKLMQSYADEQVKKALEDQGKICKCKIPNVDSKLICNKCNNDFK